MTRPRASPGAIALLLLLPAFAASALPGSTAQGDLPQAEVRLAPRAGDAGLGFTVMAANASADVSVVLTHEDPLQGAVVDRVVPLRVGADASAEVTIEDFRLDTSFRATVTGGDVPLLNATLQPVPREARDHADYVQTYPAFGAGEGSGGQILVTWRGDVLVGYTHLDNAHGAFPGRASLLAKVSSDGGHAFAPAIVVAQRDVNGAFTWTSAEMADGRVAYVYSLGVRADGAATREPWRIAVLDPVEGRVLSDAVLGEAQGFRLRVEDDAPPRIASLPDGDALLAFRGTVERADGQPRDADGGVLLWRSSPDGALSFIDRLLPEDPADGAVSGVQVAASRSGAVGLVAVLARDGKPATAAVSVSTDGGASFPALRAVPGVVPADAVLFRPEFAVLDDSGALQATFLGYAAQDVLSWTTLAEGYHARVGPDGVAVARSVRDLVPGATRDASATVYSFEVLSRDARVWLFWTIKGPTKDAKGGLELWAMESTDGGLTFDAPYRIRDVEDRGPIPITSYGGHAAGLMPDGRPIVLTAKVSDYFVAPVFDPSPPPATRLVTVTVGPIVEVVWRSALPGGEASSGSAPPPAPASPPSAPPEVRTQLPVPDAGRPVPWAGLLAALALSVAAGLRRRAR